METKLSSKGQVIIPKKVREDLGWEEGTTLVVQETLRGVYLIEVPKNPLQALEGIAKGLDISSKDVKKMRMEDEGHDRRKYSG